VASKRKGLREISWNDEKYCIYALGHMDKAEFLNEVRNLKGSEVEQEFRDELTTEDVQHQRFRPMSPPEARSRGYDYGVMTTKEGGYAVTSVLV
jgi:hypothetical protein